MCFQVGPVSDEQLNSAFEILKVTAIWLKSKGRRQRIANTDFQTYQGWQASGANYAVFLGNQIAGIFSLPVESFSDWPAFAQRGSAVWLRALATHPRFRGRRVGETAVHSALQIAGPGEPIYLDCISDFLPAYYRRMGFEVLSRQTRSYPGDGTYDITLLWHSNRDPGEDAQ